MSTPKKIINTVILTKTKNYSKKKRYRRQDKLKYVVLIKNLNNLKSTVYFSHGN